MVIAFLWYGGPETEARRVFSKLLDLNPVMQRSGPIPYNKTNENHDPACLKGGRKPTFSIGLRGLDEESMRSAWRQWMEFTTTYEHTKASTVIVENYDYSKVREVEPDSTAFPWRQNISHL